MYRTLLRLVVAGISVVALAGVAQACPFCGGVSLTLSEEMKTGTAAVVARLVSLPPAPKEGTAAVTAADSKAVFEITNALKGEDLLKTADAPAKGRRIDVIYFGQDEPGKLFLLIGTDTPNVTWGTPIPLTERSAQYVASLPGLAESGADRLAFFQEYFEDPEELLARDAYDEFAKAPYAEVKALKDRMQRDKLVARIKDPNVSPSRRRLYLTMLGICGGKDDLPMLEEMIKSDDREQKTALDATIACYLTLYGTEGLPLVEERFLKKADTEYTDTYAAIMALRFHGQEESTIPKERLVAALRHMLDRPQLADLVIPDLARWQDWSAMDRLVQLFKEADDESSWVRVPVIKYLKECPLPEAKKHIEELAKIDPKTVQQANSFFPLTGAPAPPPAPADTAGAPATPQATEAVPASPNNATPAPPADAQTANTPPAAESAAATDPSGQPAPSDQPAGGKTETEEPAAAAAAGPSQSPPPGPAGGTGEASPEAPPTETAKADEVLAGTIKSDAAERTAEIRENPLNTTVWVLAVPLAVGVVLMVLLLLILRGQRRAAGT